ncbi:Metal transporter, ZIP family, partial [Pseudomonas fluorescens]
VTSLVFRKHDHAQLVEHGVEWRLAGAVVLGDADCRHRIAAHQRLRGIGRRGRKQPAAGRAGRLVGFRRDGIGRSGSHGPARHCLTYPRHHARLRCRHDARRQFVFADSAGHRRRGKNDWQFIAGCRCGGIRSGAGRGVDDRARSLRASRAPEKRPPWAGVAAHQPGLAVRPRHYLAQPARRHGDRCEFRRRRHESRPAADHRHRHSGHPRRSGHRTGTARDRYFRLARGADRHWFGFDGAVGLCDRAGGLQRLCPGLSDRAGAGRRGNDLCRIPRSDSGNPPQRSRDPGHAGADAWLRGDDVSRYCVGL